MDWGGRGEAPLLTNLCQEEAEWEPEKILLPSFPGSPTAESPFMKEGLSQLGYAEEGNQAPRLCLCGPHGWHAQAMGGVPCPAEKGMNSVSAHCSAGSQ